MYMLLKKCRFVVLYLGVAALLEAPVAHGFSTYKMPKVEHYMQPIDGDTVVLLHGILRSHYHMGRLARSLQDDGYYVLNLDYPSRKVPIEKIVEHVAYEIERKAPSARPVHLVGYSLGALVIRALLKKYPDLPYGRIVLLAPPNEGSELADYWKDHRLFQMIFGPAGQQLVTDQSDFEHLFIESLEGFEAGIIAGDRTVDPISSEMLPGPNDGKVTVASTYLEGVEEHIVVPATHFFFPQTPVVIERTRHFLSQGRF